MSDKYEMTLERVLDEHEEAYIVSFMFYAEPNVRDMRILEEGLQRMFDGRLYINLLKIDEEAARAFNEQRGWKMTFMFSEKPNMDNTDIMYLIAAGLKELRVKHKWIESKEMKKDV